MSSIVARKNQPNHRPMNLAVSKIAGAKKTKRTGEIWPQLGSLIATMMFVGTLFRQYLPAQFRFWVERYVNKFMKFFDPYITITFHEHTKEVRKRSAVYAAIQSYLSNKLSTSARLLKAEDVKDSNSVVLAIDDSEEVIDEFNGVKLWWASMKIATKQSSYSNPQSEKRSYQLSFHRRHREKITTNYLNQVIAEGKEIALRKRQRKLYINNPSQNWYSYRGTMWSHVTFEHPATFESLAMHPKEKQEIVNDLEKFSKGKEYYARIGKAWKRGYLLYGPPGTGKSTMIAAMSNYMNYDVYDIELTTVKDNTDLRKLLINTPSKAIIVIEDIDCSLDLTGQRKKKEKEGDEEEEEKDEKDLTKKRRPEMEPQGSKVTLSGLLNFIDGISSACGGERLIVFTTNYVDKLDPALIRRGRMDKHIELGYCCFEAFKVLARNYLDLDSHELFGRIEELFGEVEMTPADVAENLMPKSEEDDAGSCLEKLIETLEAARVKAEAARVKAEEGAKKKIEKEEAKKKREEEARKKTEEAKLAAEKDDESVKNGVICNGTFV